MKSAKRRKPNPGLNLGQVKDWHDPHNEACENNLNIGYDCTCKRPRKRKPFRVIKVHDEGVGHNVNPNIVMEIYPTNGAIAFREARRRKRYHTTAADVYAWLVRNAALRAIHEKKAARKNRRKKGGAK